MQQRGGRTGRRSYVFLEFKNVATVIYTLQTMIKIAVKFILIVLVPCNVIQFWLHLDRNGFKWIMNVAQTKT